MRRGAAVFLALIALRAFAAVPSIANGSFEKGFTGWTVTERFYNVVVANAHDGHRVAVLGTSPNNLVALNGARGSLSQQLTLPANSSASLVFWLQITTQEPAAAAAADQFFLDVLSQSGALLKSELTLSNRDAAAAWTRRTVSLAPYAGKTIWIRFRGVTDAKNPTVFRLDDVSLQAPTSITGVVTSSATGAKINGATVTFAGSTPVQTGADGRFTLNDVPCIAGTLSVAASGFTTANPAYTPACGVVNQKDVALDPPPTSLIGYVWDSSTNAHLLNVTVTFAGQTQHTNSAGGYVFASVPCRSDSLVFTASGFDVYRIDNYKPDCGKSNEIDVPLTPQLTAVIGFVSDSDLHIAIANARVTLGAYSTTTNERGAYLIPGIACTPATLTISAPGYVTVSRPFTPNCQHTSMENARLTPQLTTIQGVVTDRFTTTVLTNASVLMNKTTATTQGGSYALEVPCSVVVLKVSAPDHVPLVQYITPACGTVNQVDFALPPLPSGVSACGRIANADDSRGLSGVTASIGTRSVVTDGYGSYCIASTFCSSPVTISFSKPGYRSTSRTLTLGCSGPTILDDWLMSEAHVDGKVIDSATKSPIVGASVTYGTDHTETGLGGRFSFRGFCREQDQINVTMPGFQPYSAQATGVICSNVLPAIATIALQPSATHLFVELQDSRTVKGIPDAFVRWAGLPAVPDGLGGYAFTQVQCQTASLVAESLRYGTTRVALTPACNASIVQPAGLTPVRTSIRGTVNDGIHGGPLAGATATWQSISVTTDKSGLFIFDYVPCGSGKITIGKAGYKSQDVTVNADCYNELNFGGNTTLGP